MSSLQPITSASSAWALEDAALRRSVSARATGGTVIVGGGARHIAVLAPEVVVA